MELDHTLIEDEPSFYSATAGGNPEEQYGIFYFFKKLNRFHQKRIHSDNILLYFANIYIYIYRFIVKDRGTSYNSAQRSLMVMQILLRTKFDDSEKSGIRRLINDSTYLACFPLHEGRYDRAHSSGAIFDRRVCYDRI